MIKVIGIFKVSDSDQYLNRQINIVLKAINLIHETALYIKNDCIIDG